MYAYQNDFKTLFLLIAYINVNSVGFLHALVTAYIENYRRNTIP